jgi:iron complex transport system substrate-binding protein
MDAFSIHGNIKAPSQRIISLAPSITEMLFYLGMGSSVVGATRQCNYPEEVRNKEIIGSFLIPDTKRILKLSPDTIIGLSNLHKHMHEIIPKNIGVILLDYHNVQDILDVMAVISSLALEPKAALAIVTSLKRRLNLLEKSRNRDGNMRTLFLINDSPIMIPAFNSYQYDALRVTGATQLANSHTQYERVTLEEVVYFDPEIILACGRHKGEPLPKMCPDCHSTQPICQRVVDDIALKPKWRETSAAATGNIIATPCHWLCRPGPRLIDGMESIFKILHIHKHD